MSGIRWTQEDYEKYLASKHCTAVSPANPQRDAGDGAPAKNDRQEVDTKFRIHFHSKRRRAIDPDGLYSKAAIDGLREGGLFVDDSAAYVEAVTYSQESAEDEETVIEVWEVKL